MPNNHREIINFINASFLSVENKRVLLTRLEADGPSDAFFEHMQKLFIDEITTRTKNYEKATDKLETDYETLNKEYKEKRERLDSELEERLKNIDTTDLTGKEKVFDWYYKEVDLVQNNFEKKARELFSNLAQSVI